MCYAHINNCAFPLNTSEKIYKKLQWLPEERGTGEQEWEGRLFYIFFYTVFEVFKPGIYLTYICMYIYTYVYIYIYIYIYVYIYILMCFLKSQC